MPTSYTTSWDLTFVIGELAIAPQVAGHGYGRVLLERLLAAPQARNASPTLVSCGSGNEIAAAYYRTFGFDDLLTDVRFGSEGTAWRLMQLTRDTPHGRS